MIKRILIVDDSRVARMAIKKFIPNDKGYEITEAENGQEGLNRFRESHPDITFLDITMPVMDGFRCLEEIIKADKDAIVIMATADVQVKAMERVKALGAFTIIKKPVTRETVHDALLKAQERLG